MVARSLTPLLATVPLKPSECTAVAVVVEVGANGSEDRTTGGGRVMVMLCVVKTCSRTDPAVAVAVEVGADGSEDRTTGGGRAMVMLRVVKMCSCTDCSSFSSSSRVTTGGGGAVEDERAPDWNTEFRYCCRARFEGMEIRGMEI